MGREANEIKKEILEYCLVRGHYVYPVNNAPSRRHKGTTERGVADILGCDKKGRALAIEIKTENDRQSEAQKIFQEHYKKRGGIYIIARSIEDVIKAGL